MTERPRHARHNTEQCMAPKWRMEGAAEFTSACDALVETDQQAAFIVQQRGTVTRRLAECSAYGVHERNCADTEQPCWGSGCACDIRTKSSAAEPLRGQQKHGPPVHSLVYTIPACTS